MMARRKTANCTFKFSFPLLPPPPPPLRQNSPTNSRKIVGIKAAPINPRRGFIRRKRRVSSRRDSRVGRDATRQSDPFSRNIYITRGYWRGFLTRRQNIDTTTDILVCSFALPSRNLYDIDRKSSLPSKRRGMKMERARGHS